MSVSRRDLLRWQFDLTWSLLDLHLERLKPEDFLCGGVTISTLTSGSCSKVSARRFGSAPPSATATS